MPYPLVKPEVAHQVVVEISEDFPNTFFYAPVHNNTFKSRYTLYAYRTVSALFRDVERKGIDLGVSQASFYKKRVKLPDSLPDDGLLIYEHNNIEIRALQLISITG